MKVYVAGPITGKPNANRRAFADACAALESIGCETVNPHDIIPVDHEGPCPNGPPGGEATSEHLAPCYMRGDLKALLECDAAFFLQGWEYSTGARTEHEVARSVGLDLWYEPDNRRRDDLPHPYDSSYE